MATASVKRKSAAEALAERIDGLMDDAARRMSRAEFKQAHAKARRVVSGVRARVARRKRA